MVPSEAGWGSFQGMGLGEEGALGRPPDEGEV